MTSLAEISITLLHQRLRNRIIEILKMISLPSYVVKLGTDEVLELWYDFVDDQKLETYIEPIFTREEQEAIKRFHNLLELHYDAIPSTYSLAELQGCLSWELVLSAAKKELALFMQRGYMDEEVELT